MHEFVHKIVKKKPIIIYIEKCEMFLFFFRIRVMQN